MHTRSSGHTPRNHLHCMFECSQLCRMCQWLSHWQRHAHTPVNILSPDFLFLFCAPPPVLLFAGAPFLYPAQWRKKLLRACHAPENASVMYTSRLSHACGNVHDNVASMLMVRLQSHGPISSGPGNVYSNHETAQHHVKNVYVDEGLCNTMRVLWTQRSLEGLGIVHAALSLSSRRRPAAIGGHHLPLDM